jgi:signal transduction histidine kinase/CheY-like chemotaxis protein
MNHRVIAFSIVVIAAAWSLAGYGLTTDRENALRHAEQNGLNLARAFAQNTARVFFGIDQTLLRLIGDYRASGKDFSLPVWRQRSPLIPEQVVELAIVDASGIITHSSNAANVDGAAADLESLAYHAAGTGNTSFVGRLITNSDSSLSLKVTRPIRDDAGKLLGQAIASILPESLSHFYQSIDVGRAGFVSVVGLDGVARARAPLVAPLINAGTVENPALLAANGRAEGCYPSVSRIDSIERLVCFRKVTGLPLLVNVGLAKDEVLAGYFTARWRYLGAAAAITLIMVLMTLWLMWRERRLVNATRALRESEQRSAQKSEILEITLENMSQGIFLIEPDSRVTVINRRARELLSLPDELINEELTINKIVDWQWDHGEYGKNGEAVDPELRAFLLNGALANSPPVYERTRPNGVALEVRTIMLPNGGAVRTLTDITEYRRTEEQLATAKESAESGSRSKSAFLATMSHEIRTPLNGVIGMASLLLESQLSTEQRKSVETIQECSDALLELINDVLDFSKLEAGRLDVDPHAFNLIELCETVFNIIEPRARPKNVTLVFAPSARLPAMIESDSARLRQVLLNLVGNALKFTDNGAVILQVSPTSGDTRIRFEVTDTGIGISAEAQGRLFTEFTQVEASTARRYGGTGLGLAICKKIVSAMGGEIGVESEIGRGSTFWFELPYAAADTAPSPLMTQVSAGLRAALVAERGRARNAVERLLRELGFEVIPSGEPEDLAESDIAVVHVHHGLALDLVRGKVPAGAEKLHFLGYGVGSLTFSSRNFTMIDGALTPSSMLRALAHRGICGMQVALPTPVRQKPAPAAKRSSTSLAILLAEDNAVNQRIASTMLTNMGHTVDIAGNGRDAVAKATLRVYDVIIMDMQMPEMDGLEATRAIRALRGPEGHVPIIAMTANAFGTDRDACLAAGMNHFLSKPITAQKLFDALEPWASGIPRAQDEASDQGERKADNAPPAIDPELIDAEQMHMIQEEVGTDTLQELLISFWADAGGLLDELELALSGEDPKRASAVLHTMSGAAASLGLIGCTHACEAARAAIAERRQPDLDTLATVLAKTLQATQSRIVDAQAAA